MQPLHVQLQRVKDLTPPDFGTLVQWEKRAIGSIRAGGENLGAFDDSVKTAHAQGLTGTPMPFLGETKVEVALAGDVKKEEKDETAAGPTKVLPPWMIREGMALNDKQRGEANKEEGNEDTDGPSNADIKPAEDDKDAVARKLQEEYLRAYYAAMYAASQQNASQAAAAAAPNETSTETAAEGTSGDVVKKEVEDDEDVEWEEQDTSAAGAMHENPGEKGTMPMEDQGDGVGEADDDDVDWEEG